MIPVVLLLHPHLGEHLLDALLVRLGTTLSRLFSLFLPPSLNKPHSIVPVSDDGYDGCDT